MSIEIKEFDNQRQLRRWADPLHKSGEIIHVWEKPLSCADPLRYSTYSVKYLAFVAPHEMDEQGVDAVFDSYQSDNA